MMPCLPKYNNLFIYLNRYLSIFIGYKKLCVLITEIERFNSQTISSRFEQLSVEGARIAERKENDKRIVLYSMGKFFVETWFNSASKEPFRIDCFTAESSKMGIYIETADFFL
jgi:hypothetical protein